LSAFATQNSAIFYLGSLASSYPDLRRKTGPLLLNFAVSNFDYYLVAYWTNLIADWLAF